MSASMERSPDFSQSPTRISHRFRTAALNHPSGSFSRSSFPDNNGSHIDQPGTSQSVSAREEPDLTRTRRDHSLDQSSSLARTSRRSENVQRPFLCQRRQPLSSQEPGKKQQQSKKKKGMKAAAMCLICLEKGRKDLFCTNCGHTFHKSCLAEWDKVQKKRKQPEKICPTCKKKYGRFFKIRM
ncbi:uncharacterized protein LOC127750884 [Frankliniella occidentalis]|uniref:Uncharacterized protein LOC127750884 n=1 Tax=Frankliniella occidentalis TaxID=133901 RepID=A0A9C6XSH0_FRAOC|nr:uncharacterized protein LOC127750884 [Frankliniella occidentalis]